MAWIRCCGGSKAPSFPWNATTDGTWTRKTVTTSSSDSQNMDCLTLSPKLKNNSRLICTITCSSSGCFTNVDVSTNGSTWTRLGSTQAGPTSNYDLSLASLENQQIYIRVVTKNTVGTSQTCTVTSCYVTG